ncbi:TPA: hypothetical protein ACWLXL_004382 [Pseudomonas aeruginosa]
MSTPLLFTQELESSDTLIVNLPFSPIFDMLNTEILMSASGVAYNNGGLCRNNAIVGGNNTQKTGMTVLGMARVLIRFKGSIVFFFDIEATFSVDRLAEMIDREIGIPEYFNEQILGKRFFYFSRNDLVNPCDGTFVHDKFKWLKGKIAEQIKAKADIFMKTPFTDSKGKPVKIITPILCVVDSISEMPFHRVSEHFQEGDVDQGGEKKTRDLVIGNLRRIVYEDADILGGVSGCYQIWVAQVVDKINMTGRPEEKESIFIRPGKKLKGPKAMMRIPQIGHEILKGSVLKGGSNGQEWLYPNPFGKDVIVTPDAKEMPDLMIYNNQPYRNKAGMSGINAFFIGSQSMGIQEGLTMYHVLKTAKYFGLEGSDRSHHCIPYPDLKVGRTTVWENTIEDRKFLRALTIIYHLWFMQTFWLTLPHKYRLTPQALYDGIIAQGLDWNDILENTVDYWYTNPDIDKYTVTTYELIRIALGERKPYWKEKGAPKAIV